MLKTDEEVYKDYCELMGHDYPKDSKILKILLNWVSLIRKDEPRINSGVHLIDYTMICDNDDDMDSFYGSDYRWD